MNPADRIVAEVAAARGVSPAAIRLPLRTRLHCYARHEAAYRIRTELGYSYPLIAKALCLKDHTSAIHGACAHYARINGHCHKKPTRFAAEIKTPKDKTVSIRTMKSYRPIVMKAPKPVKRPSGLIARNAHRTKFVAEWIADGGTAFEALEPYGFGPNLATAFMKTYLPEIHGKTGRDRQNAAARVLAA